MKTNLLKIGMVVIAFFASSTANAQCPTITCPGDITVNNDPGTCGAVVSYVTPVGTDACSVSSTGNVLFVSDGIVGTAGEIPAELTAAGYTVTSVYGDHNSTTKDNATLQGGGLSAYSAIFWHASGNSGFGDTHSAATFTALSAYVNAGGAVFITGYDVIASPTDFELITFMGGTSSTDGGTQGTETLVGANSLTTGVTNIVGLTLNYTGDHDGLNGLQPGTIAVASNPGGTSHGWTIKTLGAGEIAWVSTANSTGVAWPAWNTTGSGYKEALLNFASNHSCSSSNVLFVSDGIAGTAGEIPAELTAAGYNVTTVYGDHNSTTKNNAVLQAGGLSAYSAIFWHASGSGGYGDTHSAATFSALSTYVNAGGAVFVTGYDVIASPLDPELITFMGGTSSTDGGSQGTETLVGANSLTTGVTNIVGLVLNSTGDHDGLNNLQTGTVAVATNVNNNSHGWTIRTLGSGEIAWVSSANATGSTWTQWNTAGTGYKEALLNFAFNHSCGATIGAPVTTMTAGLADGSTFPLGATTVTYEVVDGNGNNPQTCSFIVTVVDNEAPVADIATLADVTAECEVTTLTAPTATDNCSATVTVTNNATLPISTSGTTVITWSYDDGNGNISTQDQNVVIADVTAPMADVTTLSDVTGACDVTPTAPTATDNCSGSLTGVSNVTFPISTAGTTVVTWTYDDGNGNTSTQDQNIIVTGVDTGVTQVGATLTADATGVSYQWIDCDSNTVIGGETSASFTATNLVGNYAVIITDGNCVDTSACYLVDFTGIDDLTNAGISIYPNPSTGLFTIESLQSLESVQILDIRGRLVYEATSLNESSVEVNISNENAGVYYVRMSGTFGTITEKVTLH